MSIQISVIIPARNAEESLRQCLTSILNQTIDRSQYEVVVIDNASEDNTRQVAEDFGVRCIFEPKINRGAARNCGIRHSSGPLVAFIDADTTIESNWLEILSSAMQDSSLGGIQGKLRFLAHKQGYQDLDFEIGSFKHLGFLFTGACIYRRTALASVQNFSESLVRHEDVDLSIKTLLAGWKIASTTRTIAHTPACRGIRIRTQIEVGAAMVQIIDRWRVLFRYTPWSGIRETFATWWRQYKNDSTTSHLIAFIRCCIRTTALLTYSLFSSEKPSQYPEVVQILPPVSIDNSTLKWSPGARVIYTESTTKISDIHTDTLVMIEGSGDLFIKFLLSNDGDFVKAIAELQATYGHVDSINNDMISLLTEIKSVGLLS